MEFALNRVLERGRERERTQDKPIKEKEKTVLLSIIIVCALEDHNSHS